MYCRERFGTQSKSADRKYRIFTIVCAREEPERAISSPDYFNLGERIEADLRGRYWHPEFGYEKAILYAERVADSRPGEKPPAERFLVWFVGMSFKGTNLQKPLWGTTPTVW